MTQPDVLLIPGPPRLFGCHRGHRFQAPLPFTITFGFQDGQVRSGALCPECLVAALNLMAAAQELTTEEAPG